MLDKLNGLLGQEVTVSTYFRNSITNVGVTGTLDLEGSDTYPLYSVRGGQSWFSFKLSEVTSVEHVTMEEGFNFWLVEVMPTR